MEAERPQRGEAGSLEHLTERAIEFLRRLLSVDLHPDIRAQSADLEVTRFLLPQIEARISGVTEQDGPPAVSGDTP